MHLSPYSSLFRSPPGRTSRGHAIIAGLLALEQGRRPLRLLAADEAVAVGVDALEVVGRAQELARGNVAVAVAVHLLEPQEVGAGPVERQHRRLARREGVRPRPAQARLA